MTAGFGTSRSCAIYLSPRKIMTLDLYLGTGAGLGTDRWTTQHRHRCQGKPLGERGRVVGASAHRLGAGDTAMPS